MADNNAKRLFAILEILKKYTDADHRISQTEIEKLLWELYGISANRKTVKSNIMSLIEFGYNVEYSEKPRITKNKKTGEPEENTVMYDFYLENDFDDTELRLLIDSVLFSPNISASNSRAMIKKLANLSSEYFGTHIDHITRMPVSKSDGKELFHTIEVTDQAIEQGKKIRFKYLRYGDDFKLHPARAMNAKTNLPGSEIRFRMSPYQMVIADGRYYLICGHVHNKVKQLQMDRIKDIEILDDDADPLSTLVDDNNQTVSLKEYVSRFTSQYTLDKTPVKLRIYSGMIDKIVDTFGKKITVVSRDKGFLDIAFSAPRQLLMDFVKLNAPAAVVLEPEDLKKEMLDIFKIAYGRHMREL